MAEPSHPAGDYAIADDVTIDRARSNDSDALADLWAIYQPQVLALLRSRGAEPIDDIASQVWLEVGRSMDRFRGDGVDFRRWIFTIAGRRTIDERRRARRRREVSVESMSNVSPGHQDDDRPATSYAAAKALLSSLTPALAEVIMLRIVHDMSVAQVAAATGRSEGHVRVLTHRGLALLRESTESQLDSSAGTLAASDGADPSVSEIDESDPIEVGPADLSALIDAQPVGARV